MSWKPWYKHNKTNTTKQNTKKMAHIFLDILHITSEVGLMKLCYVSFTVLNSTLTMISLKTDGCFIHTVAPYYTNQLLAYYLVNSQQLIWRSRSTLEWRHNGRDGVSNHLPRDCLLNRLFRRSSKKTSKFRVTGLCAGNSPVTGEFPAQMASNAENVSIWWRHHDRRWNLLVRDLQMSW